MTDAPDTYAMLAAGDDALLADCEVDTYRASGPGGQHRNKTSSAVRLRHRPTGVIATAAESRSQHENKHRALQRLRMHIATQCRQAAADPPAFVLECRFTPKPQARTSPAASQLQVGRKDRRYWLVVAWLLDAMEAREGRLADVAALLGISTGNLTRVLKADRHALAAAQDIRRRHDQKPIS
jgi:AraC-like DNA-binding protein